MFWFFEALFNYAKFSGRCSRAQFWWFILFYIAGYWLFLFVDYQSPTLIDIESEKIPIWFNLYSWLTLLPFVAVSVRRLHDIEKSGWNLILGFIPLLSFVLIYYQAKRGTEGDNRFGESIKGTLPVKATYKRVVKTLFISIIVVTFMLISFAYADIYNKGELSDINGLDGFVKSLSLVIYTLCALLALAFCLDWGKRQKTEQTDGPALEDEFAGLGLEDDLGSGTGLDEEDAFEELEPLDMDAEPIESHSSIGAEKMEIFEDEDPDMDKLEI